MKEVKNKHLKMKKKNFIIFLICICLILGSLYYGVCLITKKPKEIAPITKEETPKEKDTSFEGASKLSYYIKENDERYRNYRKQNKELTTEQIVTEVNIGLDHEYYENASPTIKLNTQYILVNKYNFLTGDYIPENLEEINNQYALKGMRLVNYAKEAFEEMSKAAKNENLSIIAMSTYRSYAYQENLYNNYVKKDGKEEADTYSGRPGHSEHQTGLAVDVYNGKVTYTSFETTEEFKWMQENAYKYGFILRFPEDKTKQTGYQYESWHYRYVGKEAAQYIHEHKISYEEYYVQFIENK